MNDKDRLVLRILIAMAAAFVLGAVTAWIAWRPHLAFRGSWRGIDEIGFYRLEPYRSYRWVFSDAKISTSEGWKSIVLEGDPIAPTNFHYGRRLWPRYYHVGMVQFATNHAIVGFYTNAP